MRCVGACRTMRRPDGDRREVTMFDFGVTCVPTRIVLVLPVVTREEYGVAAAFTPEIDIDEEMGAETNDRNSQIPGACGFVFT